MGRKPAGAGKDRELENLRRMRKIRLAEPLTEATRPDSLEDIIGQDSGVKALRAALCGQNPRHVIIYGPPGVGKTAAARVILEYAKKNGLSAFKSGAPFVELDGAALQFDERGVADPLIGSVHDPIYQGAGLLGQSGVPQPRPGAVTKAHGGVLFIDEIGELHNSQMIKLLKVLEDRRVFLSSSYYSPANTSIPDYIHDIFENGLPADFRLVGATTRRPEDIPQALRSRCAEVYFKGLTQGEIRSIAGNAFHQACFGYEPGVLETVSAHSSNGREAVGIVQQAISLASQEKRRSVTLDDASWAVEAGRYNPRRDARLPPGGIAGVAHGAAITDGTVGMILEIEAAADKAAAHNTGKLTVTGIACGEEITVPTGSLRRRGSALGSVENALTLMRTFGVNPSDYDIHINFPSTGPVDGPSAGLAVFAALYSAVTGLLVPGRLVLLGELTIKGRVAAIGGAGAKLEAAALAGAETAVIPAANYQESFSRLPMTIIPAETAEQAIAAVFGIKTNISIGRDKNLPLTPVM
jgi:Lon-like ATP-dependent protease